MASEEGKAGPAFSASKSILGDIHKSAKAGLDGSCESTAVPFAGTSPPNPTQLFKQLIFVRYLDHVLYNRNSAVVMKPQTREAVGWLVYDCQLYLTLSWDRDAEPPALHGGDPKASGLVLLKSDILDLQLLNVSPIPLQNIFDWNLNCKQHIQEPEYAFRSSERKTQSKGATAT
jgi:hypothetical protein